MANAYQCPKCGGANLVWDAVAIWENEAQCFVCDGVRDSVDCLDCGETFEKGIAPVDVPDPVPVPVETRSSSEGSSPAYLVEAEHPYNPGRILELHATIAGAEAFALELVNIMRKDCDMEPARDWRRGLAGLQRKRDGDDCFVDIIPLTLQPDTQGVDHAPR